MRNFSPNIAITILISTIFIVSITASSPWSISLVIHIVIVFTWRQVWRYILLIFLTDLLDSTVNIAIISKLDSILCISEGSDLKIDSASWILLDLWTTGNRIFIISIHRTEALKTGTRTFRRIHLWTSLCIYLRIFKLTLEILGSIGIVFRNNRIDIGTLFRRRHRNGIIQPISLLRRERLSFFTIRRWLFSL